ncbi:MAG: hypothetical protein IT578_10250, partial [Verrucomicrobiae bacterium]|nr:hypothetical protein [Verrucomicrobiae bacterium]
MTLHPPRLAKQNRLGYPSPLPSTLPIHAAADEIARAFREHTRVLLTAPTGSGKSTQTPQILLDRGLLGSGQ